MYLQGVRCGNMGWMELAQDRDKWQAVVTTVMNLRVSITAGYFSTS